MKHCVSKLAKCPYYHQHESLRIFCEGVEDGTSLQLAFDSSAHQQCYRKRLCHTMHWSACPVAEMLNKKRDW